MWLYWNTGKGDIIAKVRVENRKILHMKGREKARTELRGTVKVGWQVIENEGKGENKVLKMGD